MHKSAKRIPLSIRQDRAFVARFLSKVLVGNEEECWLWIGALSPNGYGKIVSTQVNNERKQYIASRIACTLFWGEIPEGFVVMHKCDNPPCVNPWHLVAGTPNDNTQDMIKKGRRRFGNAKRGPENKKTKLTPEQVIEIRSQRETRSLYAKKYGVSRDCIRHAQTGVTFKYLPSIAALDAVLRLVPDEGDGAQEGRAETPHGG